jgi:cardiolipin synthase
VNSGRIWCDAAALLAGLFLAACAGLPTVSLVEAKATAREVVRESAARGEFPVPGSEALLRKRWSGSTLDANALAILEESATGVPLIAGNEVRLLFDGPSTMAEMAKAITAAKSSINLETYVFDQDEQGNRFADLLILKQAEGVVVNVIYDSVGTINVPQAFFERMRAAGIELIAFNPVNPFRLSGNGWKWNNRDHRKLLVVDGKVAFTGGVNISNAYANSSPFRARSDKRAKDAGDSGWRDTHLRIEGPAVAALQWTFVHAWLEQHAGRLREADYFPAQTLAGDKVARVLASEPQGRFEIYRAFLLAVQGAKKSIHITCAYFVPDEQTLQALTAAAQRGVSVRLVLPSVSDAGIVLQASRASYTHLLEAGVRIHELSHSVLHVKAAVVDGVWSTVGSTNIDKRSFLHNHELNVIVIGDAFGAQMEGAFQEDLRNSVEVTLAGWQRRPMHVRLGEWLADLLSYWF